jgi:hypothetical protein
MSRHMRLTVILLPQSRGFNDGVLCVGVWCGSLLRGGWVFMVWLSVVRC